MRLLLCLLRILFLTWVSLIEHCWVILPERRGYKDCERKIAKALSIPNRDCELRRELNSHLGKVDVSALDIGTKKFDAQFVSDVHSSLAQSQHAFDVRLQDPHKCPMRIHAGNDRVECLADPTAHRNGSNAF